MDRQTDIWMVRQGDVQIDRQMESETGRWTDGFVVILGGEHTDGWTVDSGQTNRWPGGQTERWLVTDRWTVTDGYSQRQTNKQTNVYSKTDAQSQTDGQSHAHA
jgi:hypothetical protein